MQRQQAQELGDWLDEHQIAYRIGDNLPVYDLHFSASVHADRYEVQISPADFPKAEQLLKTWEKEQLADLPADYYLFEFSDEELYSILIAPDTWHDRDVALAEQILKQRGVIVVAQQLESLRKLRNEQLAIPEQNQSAWIVIGYVVALLSFGVISSFIGYTIWKSQKVLPNGKQVYSYREKDRKKGAVLFWFSLFLVLISVLFQVKDFFLG